MGLDDWAADASTADATANLRRRGEVTSCCLAIAENVGCGRRTFVAIRHADTETARGWPSRSTSGTRPGTARAHRRRGRHRQGDGGWRSIPEPGTCDPPGRPPPRRTRQRPPCRRPPARGRRGPSGTADPNHRRRRTSGPRRQRSGRSLRSIRPAAHSITTSTTLASVTDCDSSRVEARSRASAAHDRAPVRSPRSNSITLSRTLTAGPTNDAAPYSPLSITWAASAALSRAPVIQSIPIWVAWQKASSPGSGRSAWICVAAASWRRAAATSPRSR